MAWPDKRPEYAGFLLIKKYKCFAFDTAKRSSKHVDAALLSPPPREVVQTTWNDAVIDTANLWQSIFHRALGPEKSQELHGIRAPKGETGTGWFC
jgi:hypothetical protein